MKTYKTNDPFKLMVLLYLSIKYPNYTDENIVIDNNMAPIEDEIYNDIFFEMVYDVRKKFLTEQDDESIANGIIESYMSNGSFEWHEAPKQFEVTLYFKDEPEEEISGFIMQIGDFDEETATEEEKIADQNIFYYLQSEQELKDMMDEDTAVDFVVTSYEPLN